MSQATIDKILGLKDDVVIDISHLTKDYGKGRGIFDISFKVPKGCTFGYCGTNGAGKTTTLRHIMGFLKPDSGTVRVNGLDPWKQGETIKRSIGYLPGEIAFPAVENGSAFLKSQAELIGLTDMSKAERIINAMQLDPTANLKRMSKGMKQKTAIVATFMASPDIILLDEPTTGLDPLMREAFIEILEEEKARGATILMSNHMFDELEETCDYVGFINEGHLIDIVDMEEIHKRPFREFNVCFIKEADYKKAFTDPRFNVIMRVDNFLQVIVRVDGKTADLAVAELAKYPVKQCTEIKYTLEKYFLENFGGNNNGNSDQK